MKLFKIDVRNKVEIATTGLLVEANCEAHAKMKVRRMNEEWTVVNVSLLQVFDDDLNVWEM